MCLRLNPQVKRPLNLLLSQVRTNTLLLSSKAPSARRLLGSGTTRTNPGSLGSMSSTNISLTKSHSVPRRVTSCVPQDTLIGSCGNLRRTHSVWRTSWLWIKRLTYTLITYGCTSTEWLHQHQRVKLWLWRIMNRSSLLTMPSEQKRFTTSLKWHLSRRDSSWLVTEGTWRCGSGVKRTINQLVRMGSEICMSSSGHGNCKMCRLAQSYH